MKKFLIVFLLFFSITVSAQIPSPQSFLGYELGKHFTPHNKIVAYFEAVAKASPQTMKLEKYGVTNEGRPLELAYISTADNIANLEQIRINNLRLAGVENGTSPDVANQKVIVWLSYNVHGNEPSSSEASMATLYEFLTSNTTNAKEWLKNTVVIIDPCINPDGRERYVSWFNNMVGIAPNPDPQSREHSEPWPGGRTNHYNFDLNRDWAWQTQLETQQRMKKYNEWMPQIHCDYHEQGINSPYYFAPASAPYHEVITPWQKDFQGTIGHNHAKYFDANSWLYFTKETFDLFYPSYGDTWPLYNGAIGMTYEQGGGPRGGLAIINSDGDTLTLHDRIMHHFTTGISTVEIASQHAKELLINFKKFFDNARANGVGEYKSFVLKARGNENKISELLDLLDKNGIAYHSAVSVTAKGYDYFTGKTETINLEKGDLVVSTLQTKGVLAKVLFEPKSKLEDSATYDITAWSLPYAYGIQAYAIKEKIAVAEYQKPVTPANNIANINVYGFIKPWQNFADAQFLAQLMKKGVKVRMSEKAFTVKNKTYQPGSLIIIKTSNQKMLDFTKTILLLANENHVVLDTISTGFVDKGADFGSRDVHGLWAPRVACLTGETVGSLGAGEVWHFFEKKLNYPITMINASEIGREDLKRYDVMILPNGNYKNVFAKDGAVKMWVQQGGRLIVMEDAVSQLAEADWGLTAKNADGDKGDKGKDAAKDDDLYANIKPYGNAERESLKESNPGSIYKVELDNTHPLAFGYPNYYYTLKSDNTVYEFLKSGWNVGIVKKDNQVAGFTGIKARKKIMDGVLLGQFSQGRGSVVFFADDPLFRSFWANGRLLFANAVFMVDGGNHL